MAQKSGLIRPGEIARTADRVVTTVHYWEKRLNLRPERTGANDRRYTEEQATQILSAIAEAGHRRRGKR